MKLADDDKAAVAQVLTDYYRAFSTLDAQAVGSYAVRNGRDPRRG
jgi:hypothetical protein